MFPPAANSEVTLLPNIYYDFEVINVCHSLVSGHEFMLSFYHDYVFNFFFFQKPYPQNIYMSTIWFWNVSVSTECFWVHTRKSKPLRTSVRMHKVGLRSILQWCCCWFQSSCFPKAAHPKFIPCFISTNWFF